MTGKQDKKHDRHKRGLKVFFLPKFHGQKHKHKKNKYYVSHDNEWSPTGSIMSGDSPTHNTRAVEMFDLGPGSNQSDRPQLLDSKPLLDGRSSPVATTSKEVAVQSVRPDDKDSDKLGKGEVQASVLVEPGKDRDDEDDKSHFGSPTLNNDDNGEEGEKDERNRNKSDNGEYGGRDKRDRKDDKSKKNGMDRLDGVWMSANDKKQDNDGETNCLVDCLYVTLTCCECNLM